jgi:hypothetical protein
MKPVSPPPQTAGHSEFRPGQFAPAKRREHRFRFAAQMRSDLHPPLFQGLEQRRSQRSTKQNIHLQVRHLVHQCCSRQCPQQNFAPPHFRALPTRHHQQTRRRVEQWRNAFLTNGKRHGHNCPKAHAVPAPQTDVAANVRRLKSNPEVWKTESGNS